MRPCLLALSELLLCAFHARQKHGPCVQLSVNCEIRDGMGAVHPTVAVVMHRQPKAIWQDQPKLCSSHRRLRYRVPAAEQKSRNVKATSGRPVAPPPPAAAQAAAPNRQQNAGTKNPNPIRFNQKSTDPGLTAEPNGPPD